MINDSDGEEEEIYVDGDVYQDFLEADDPALMADEGDMMFDDY